MLTQERQNQLNLPALSAAPHDGEGIALSEIVAMLRRRLALIVASAVIGTGLATLAGHVRTPEYTATAAILIDPLDGEILGDPGARDARAQGDPGLIDTQIALMLSRSQLEPVMRELSLLTQQREPAPRVGGDAPARDLPAALEQLAAYLPESWHRLAAYLPESWLVAAGLAQVVTPPPPPEEAKQEAIDRFRRDLEIGHTGQSMVITVRYTSPDPDWAAQVANVVAYGYVKTQLERRRQAAERAATWLQDRLGELQETVRRSEQTATDFRLEHGLGGLTGRSLNEQTLLSLNQQLNALRTERAAKEAKLRQARALRADERDIDALADGIGSPLIASLRIQEAALLHEEAELAQTYGDRHPRMTNLRAQMTEIRNKIAQEVDRSISNLRDEIAVLASREAALVADLQKIQQDQERNQQVEVRLAELERQANANRDHYEALLRRSKMTQEQEKALLPQAQVISPAVPPLGPSTPGPRVFAILGFTVSTMLGAGLGLLLERMNSRVRSASEVESALGLPVLGLMPSLPGRRARRHPAAYVAERPLSEIAESARSILTTVRLAEHSPRPGVILVTSALPREGKTTLSITLAATAVVSRHKALLIDLDLRRPMINARLGGPAGQLGLAEYLLGDLPRERLIQRERLSGIDFIPAGRPPAYPLTLLQGPELIQLIEAIREDYDYVILDSAPILAVAEARIATRLADRVILAARWQQSHIGAVAQAVRALMQAQAEIAGCVLTDVKMRKYKLYATDAGSYYGQYRSYYSN